MAYANFVLHKFSFLNITSIGSNHVVTGSECGFACVDIPSCFSFNLAAFHDIDGKVLCELLPSDIFNNSDKQIPSQSHHHYSIASPCISWPCQNNGKCAAQYEKNSYVCVCANGYIGEHCGTDIDECSASIRLCDVNANCQNSYGSYSCSYKSGISGNGKTCQDTNGWTLIARFSNSDSKNWMHDDGKWWYDQQITVGATKNSSENNDMISTAFWSVSGSEIKITRSDDPSHTPLLQTTNNCLGGQAFRSKITSYGDFRNGTVWASDQCLGSCAAQYGGQYNSTDGFQKAECSGNIQSANKIGFWCDWSTGDGSVMKIGGGGSSCARADHGIGITETGDASFVDLGTSETEYDFGYDAFTNTAPSQSYSLNLWIR
ncbi:neurogenic locus notch homolog protein 1-like isoform X2 [Stylophora pistillata]|uniref:neurogenic locus notch homolog protein 1-like isoform X2 n=1 Tax=Stylophora pistillata TaxID=50429 RepID=UPI000C048D6C|nr:neurogenic locus notch homolog protein 1-like isoform X2 [Stylophora pistillata]